MSVKIELSEEEIQVLYSAALSFASEMHGMRSRVSSMSEISLKLEEKEKLCYSLAQKLAERM